MTYNLGIKEYNSTTIETVMSEKFENPGGGNLNARLRPSMFSSRYWILTLLRKRLTATMNEHLAGRANLIVVDYGCGTMPYKSIFERKAAKYIGIDLPSKLSNDPIGSITSLPDCFADVVLSTQVLEHVDSPGEYLDECHRVLKDDGLLILSTHGYWMYHPDPEDLWRWTGEGLKKLIRAHNLHLIAFEGLMGLTASGLQLVQDGIIEKLPKFAAGGFAFFIQSLIRITDAFQSADRKTEDACVFLAVAQKLHYE